MDSLTHYDLFSVFTLREAAYLAAGVDPRDSLNNAKAETILDAMNYGLNGMSCHALAALTAEPDGRFFPQWALVPHQLHVLISRENKPFKDINEAKRWLHEFRQRRNQPDRPWLFSRDELQRWFSAMGLGYESIYLFVPKADPKLPENAPVGLGDAVSLRERTTFLNIIGALLELIQNPRSGRESQAAVISELVENYGDRAGISKRGLEAKFSEANRSLKDS